MGLLSMLGLGGKSESVKDFMDKGAVIIDVRTVGEFRDGHIKESLEAKKLDETFQTQTNIDDLYSYIRLDTINQLNEDVGLERIQIIAADGPSDYMRPILNKMDDETFELFIKYHLATCERQELIGASSHTIDILKK